MRDGQDRQPSGKPLAEGSKAAAATIAGLIPGVGPFISSALWGMLQAETAQKLNSVITELQGAVDRSGRTPEDLLADISFRTGVVQLYQSTVSQEADSKLRRIQAFLRHRLENPARSSVASEAVLRAFSTLPASHIEEFLSLISSSEEDLRDFAIVRGSQRFDLDAIIRREFPNPVDQDHCGSSTDVRVHELAILFGSLEAAGLVTRIATRGDSLLFDSTALAKDFVAYCLPPADQGNAA